MFFLIQQNSVDYLLMRVREQASTLLCIMMSAKISAALSCTTVKEEMLTVSKLKESA